MNVLMATVGLALFASQGDTLTAAVRADVGQWRLSQIGGKIACTVNLTDQASSGGHALRAPPACHLAFPPLKDVSVWNLDARGAPIFSDPGRQHIVAFSGPAGGPFQATASDGKPWRLEPATQAALTQPS